MLAIRSAYAKRRFCGPHQKILQPLDVSDEAELGATEINSRYMLKNGRMVLGSLRRFAFAMYAGCKERELLELMRFLLHLVYQADYYYEALQKGQAEGVPDFIEGFKQVLTLYGLDKSSVRQHVDDVITCFERETEIVCGREEVDESILREVTRIRSSDWRCVIQGVLAQPCLIIESTLLEWYTLYGIRQDLLQYFEDAASDTFNTLRLYVRNKRTRRRGFPVGAGQFDRGVPFGMAADKRRPIREAVACLPGILSSGPARRLALVTGHWSLAKRYAENACGAISADLPLGGVEAGFRSRLAIEFAAEERSRKLHRKSRVGKPADRGGRSPVRSRRIRDRHVEGFQGHGFCRRAALRQSDSRM
jgi:hypothetical protein